MSEDQRIELLEHRVRELQTAVVAIIGHLGIEREVAAFERSRLEEIRVRREAEAPRERLIELYGGSLHS